MLLMTIECAQSIEKQYSNHLLLLSTRTKGAVVARNDKDI